MNSLYFLIFFFRLINEKEAHVRLQQEPKIDLSSNVQTSKSNNLLDDELKKMSLAQLNRVQSPPSSQQNVFMNHQNSMISPHNSLVNQQSTMINQQNTTMSMRPLPNMFSGFPTQSMQSVSMKSPAPQWSQKNSLCNFSDLSPLNKNKVPMNSMMGSNSVMGYNPASNVTNSFNSTSQSVKPLSSSDINDLLNWDENFYTTFCSIILLTSFLSDFCLFYTCFIFDSQLEIILCGLGE